MRFFVYTAIENKTSRKPLAPDAMVEMGKFMEESLKARIVVAGGWLPATSSRIRAAEGKVSVTDGPFIEGKELIPGFTVIELATSEEAFTWADRFRQLAGIGEVRVAQIRAPG